MLDYSELEDAVRAWLVTGSGLPFEKVFRRNDKLPQQATPYVEFAVPMAGKGGAGRDELRTLANPDTLDPLDVVYTTRGQRETVVSVKFTTRSAVGNDDAEGRFSARTYAEGCVNALALPPVREALKAAGLAMIEIAAVLDTSDRSIVGGRAQLDVRFRLVDSASSKTTSIQTVDPLLLTGIV
jgi:hypothetical protein